MARPTGDPLLVHAASLTNQNAPTITRLSDGSLLVSWANYSADQTDIELIGRRFNAQGTAVGDEFLLTPTNAGVQSAAAVAALPDAGFVVAWQTPDPATGDYDVFARRFDSASVGGAAFMVNTTTSSDQMMPSIAVQGDRSLLVSWQSHGQGENASGIYAQLYDPSGNAMGGEFQVPSVTAGDQFNGQVEALASGAFFVTWVSGDGDGHGVHGRIVDAHGNPSGEQLQLHSWTAGGQSDAHGAVLGGGFVVVWESMGSDGDGSGIRARLFSSVATRDARADFDGDGRSDLLWRSDTGTLSNWVGQSNGGFANNDANALVGVPTSWRVAAIGDFNGDGHDDLLWRSDSGWLSNWLATAAGGFTPNDATALTHVSTDWQVVGVGDFNGDGRDDILWRSDTGTLSNWLGQVNGGFLNNDAAA